MSRLALLSLLLSLLLLGPTESPAWDTRTLHEDFYTEGSGVGDIDGDGKVDLASGPFWFKGPEFSEQLAFYEPKKFNIEGYSDNFFSFVHDCTGDGANDVVVFGFPGKEVRLYVNPGHDKAANGEHWPVHRLAEELGNESPAFVDLIPGGLPEIVGSKGNTYGYYEAQADGTKPWTWHPISGEGDARGRFDHSLGVGDINGDGRPDVIDRESWHEQPEDPATRPWPKHRWALISYGGGGAQILVDDVDGDGDNDLITSLNAHAYGIAWFEQREPGKFARHNILGDKSTDNPYGVVFSQPHALALADIDGDGRNDFVTGKRFFAHNGKDPGGLQEPVLYWFKNTPSENGAPVEFVPQLVHRDSGVGTEITVADLDADGRPDIISSNKHGLALHLQDSPTPKTAERWRIEEGRSQESYGTNLTPAQARDRFELPEGFEVDLIAAEPEVVQPIAMCFDARGRLWVVEGKSYPQPRAEGEGLDRILILADTNGDGSFDSRKVFAEGINLASGIETGFGGVFVGAAPNLLFFPDANGDDIPDGEPEILLDGWGHEDTHETLNAFTWGPDGWLYGCHGVFTHSRVGRPATTEEERVPLNAGVWRYHPVSHRFEVFAHGTSNPWGVDFDEHGEAFVSACVIPHFFHLSQGGLYRRQAGQHFAPYHFEDIKTIADHAHYSGAIKDHAFWGANSAARPSAPADTSLLGGGHAHCGLAIYQAEEFPARFRGDAFFHNLHGHRVVRERLEREGSGFIARHRPDLALANDHDHIGVGILQGPDGALYLSDWHDAQTCHHRDVEIWNRTDGRIFRVRYGEAKGTALTLPDRTLSELVETLGHPNALHSRLARRLLQERVASGKAQPSTIRDLLSKTKEPLDERTRLHRFWAAHACGSLEPDDLAAALDDQAPYHRAWALRFLGEAGEPLAPEVLTKLESMAKSDASPVVRRFLASLLQRLPNDQRWGIAEGLIRWGRNVHDRNLPLLTWYGIEPLVAEDPARAFALAEKSAWPVIKDYVGRRATLDPEGRAEILRGLSEARDGADFARRGNQLLAALAKLPPVPQPESWEAARTKGEELAANSPEARDVLARLGTRFGDPASFPHWRAVACDPRAKLPDRTRALDLLAIGEDPELGNLARELLDAPGLRQPAIAALRKHPGPATAEALVTRLATFPLRLRNEAVNLLASRPEMAQTLLKAVDTKEIAASLISPALLDQFARFEDAEIDALIDRNWARGGAGVDLAQLGGAIAAWRKKLSPAVLQKGDASRGRMAFNLTCGTCHQLFGRGIALGPDLTGSNRADLNYLLENVLAPSTVVGKDYLLHVLTQKDGTVVSGVVREESPDFVKVALPGGTTVDVAKAKIAKREALPQSLMPPALFDALPLEQVADLVAYLRSPQQVSLPGEGPQLASDRPVPPVAAGVLRFEGEALVRAGKAKASTGQVRPQGMRTFGSAWSGDDQLWWTGGAPGDTLTLRLEKVPAGRRDLTLFPTTARDYAQVKVTAAGHLAEADCFTAAVLPGKPIRLEKIDVAPDQPLVLVLEIIGTNPESLPAYMVGIDRVEVK